MIFDYIKSEKVIHKMYQDSIIVKFLENFSYFISVSLCHSYNGMKSVLSKLYVRAALRTSARIRRVKTYILLC